MTSVDDAAPTSPPLRKDAVRNRELLVQTAREVFTVGGLEVSLYDVERHADVVADSAPDLSRRCLPMRLARKLQAQTRRVQTCCVRTCRSSGRWRTRRAKQCSRTNSDPHTFSQRVER